MPLYFSNGFFYFIKYNRLLFPLYELLRRAIGENTFDQ
nr:MAG TPA: hypothetical protein [Caudoviricetes sp.]